MPLKNILVIYLLQLQNKNCLKTIAYIYRPFSLSIIKNSVILPKSLAKRVESCNLLSAERDFREKIPFFIDKQPASCHQSGFPRKGGQKRRCSKHPVLIV